MRGRPVGFSWFEWKLWWSLEDKRAQWMSLGEPRWLQTLMRQFVPGIRIPRSRHFVCVLPIHHTHQQGCVPRHKLSPLFVTAFLRLLSLLPFTWHESQNAWSCASIWKMKIVLASASIDGFQTNHIYYVSVHLFFAQWCMMSVGVLGWEIIQMLTKWEKYGEIGQREGQG